MLYNPPALEDKDLEVVDRIETLWRELSYAVNNQPTRWVGVLRRNAFARALQGSNSIEGYNVSVEDAMAAADGEEHPGPPVLSEQWKRKPKIRHMAVIKCEAVRDALRACR